MTNIKVRIEVLRKKLNDMIIQENIDKEELLRVSEELDVLIVGSIKRKKNYQGLALSDTIILEIEELLKRLELFKKMYNLLRIIDPVNNRVLALKKNELSDVGVCHDLWKRNMVCRNCISIKAFKENETIFKLEIMENDVYMVTAVPIVVQDKRLVLEMCKNTTNTVLLKNGTNGQDEKFSTLIDALNQVSKKR